MTKATLQDDIAAFLAAGGTIQQCDSSHNAAANAHKPMTRRELIARRKRLDTVAIEAARRGRA